MFHLISHNLSHNGRALFFARYSKRKENYLRMDISEISVYFNCFGKNLATFDKIILENISFFEHFYAYVYRANNFINFKKMPSRLRSPAHRQSTQYLLQTPSKQQNNESSPVLESINRNPSIINSNSTN